MAAVLIDFIEIQDLKRHSDMQDVAECMGIEFTRQLIAEFGGQRIYVPKATSVRPAVVRYLTANKVKDIAKLQEEIGCSTKTLLRRIAELPIDAISVNYK